MNHAFHCPDDMRVRDGLAHASIDDRGKRRALRGDRCGGAMSRRAGIVIASLVLALTGCATQRTLMPTPALYTGADARPLFTNFPIDSRQPALDLLFITDRTPSERTDGSRYTASRSRSMAFGSATIEFGEDVTWDALARDSIAPQRSERLNLTLGTTTELGRFPAIPYAVDVAPDGIRRVRAVVDAYRQATATLQADIARRLQLVHRKEVVLFVHGYHTSFQNAALTMGELCHFLGRDFVCGMFTWPAGGRRGILFGYDVDRESAEYATQDLVKVIRIIGRTPGVERVHLVAHSRGTDTVASALAELSTEAYMLRSSPEREFHIANVVLVAPDLDGDVAITKIFKVFSDPDLPFGGQADPDAVFPPAPGLRVTLYVSPDDKAIATAGWLFGSITRLGRIDPAMLSAEQISAIDMLRAVDIVQVHGTTDLFGHNYFVSNPEVSSDIVALLRYDLRPGEPGRPLEPVAGPFWRVGTR
jgi:esterase/lipase superfamily enzyme